MIFTIGHSTLELSEFVDLLIQFEVRLLIDVRSHPTSKWEQFRLENLKHSMPKTGLEYGWWPRLGGWSVEYQHLASKLLEVGVDIAAYAKGKFPKQQITQSTDPVPGKASWTNKGLYEYSWFLSLPETIEAANGLMDIGRNKNIAIMCAEAVPWRCHRSMISDYLMFKKVDSHHILNKRILKHSKMLGNRLERYDARILAAWV